MSESRSDRAAKEFHTKNKREAIRKLRDWINESPIPMKIELVISEKGLSLIAFGLTVES